ncbi:MAG TPA: hypothetical protein PK971_01610 [Saprospiraceae bacterium]|nr:hypothetical protein [Saprospiraceae bacterium]HNG89088.1 hypothetical protein [Saprospiraceae bacterium]
MHQKLALLCTLLSPLLGYMEWGGGHSAYVWQVEYDLLRGTGVQADTLSHPLVLLPLLGQVLLLALVFMTRPARRWVWVGLSLVGVLMLMLTVVGLLAFHPRILLSVLPFWVSAGWCVSVFRRAG